MEMTASEIAEYNDWLDSLDNDQLARLETQAEASFQRQELPEDFSF